MARLAARVAQQEGTHALKGSPPRRRWTRSQSRELEAHPMDIPTGKSSLNGSKWRKGKGKMSGHDLTVVAEESPVKPARKSGFRAGQVIPESPDDAHNHTMSGSTIIVPDAETDQEDDEDDLGDQDEQDPEMMLESLPGLERSAKEVLDFLVPDSADLKSIVNMAKRLSDPKNTQSKRLSLRKANLKNQPGWFEGRTYIDVTQASESIASHLTNQDGVGQEWRAEPILHRANCARFALEVLLANGNSGAFRKAIRDVEGLFPLPFMSDLVTGAQSTVGKSVLIKDTFRLALEIRTQFVIIQLENHQHDHDFDPNVILEDGFFLDVPADETFDSSNAPMRAFHLPRFSGADGSLSDEFRETAYDRFEEMRALLPDEDDIFDIGELKSTYPWRSFLLHAARWIRKRCGEIDQDSSRQQSAESTRKEYFAEVDAKDRRSLGGVPGRSSLAPRLTEERSEWDTVASPDKQRESVLPPVTHEETPSRVESRERRKSAKPAFLNKSSLERIVQRKKQPQLLSKTTEARRQSDGAARLALENAHKGSESQLRRQTLPAFRQPRPAPEEAIEGHVDDPAEELTEGPTEEHIEEPTEAHIEEPTEEHIEEPTEAHIEELTEEHIEELTEEPTEAHIEEPTEEHIEEPTEEHIDEPTEEHVEEPIEGPAFREASPLLQHDEQDFNVDSESELFVDGRAHLEKSHSPLMTRTSREPRFRTLSPVRTRLFAPELRREKPSMQASTALRPMLSSQELWRAAMGSGGLSRIAKSPESTSRFIDRQENAHRVSPISQGADPHSVERRRTETQSKKRRRAESEDEDDESGDEFTNYNRPVDTARKRAEKPVQKPSSKRQRIEEHDDSAAQLLNGLEETTRRTSVPESPEPASTRTNPVPASPEPTLKSTKPVPVSSSVKHTVASTRMAVRWTPSEDKRLIRLIQEVGLGGPKGSGWCKIARQNEAEPVREGESRIEGRSQVQLKDRARNIKIRFLKDRKPLPSNFEHVTMKEKDRAMLAAKGINVP
ncbi:hypothetical protein BDV26DRAFT_300244 [Aspergillus bertholletiae]|uniref:Myb-like domain-containing protein n=1 Tax=Aspergillus bertholletiae TaxID=1226010 RepID=A0A5N7AYK6_9EURO|nr:hypothetical protein BDV26DRAFT_300244 [Aspergillus bertholletiae]